MSFIGELKKIREKSDAKKALYVQRLIPRFIELIKIEIITDVKNGNNECYVDVARLIKDTEGAALAYETTDRGVFSYICNIDGRITGYDLLKGLVQVYPEDFMLYSKYLKSDKPAVGVFYDDCPGALVFKWDLKDR